MKKNPWHLQILKHIQTLNTHRLDSVTKLNTLAFCLQKLADTQASVILIIEMQKNNHRNVDKILAEDTEYQELLKVINDVRKLTSVVRRLRSKKQYQLDYPIHIDNLDKWIDIYNQNFDYLFHTQYLNIQST